MNHDWHPRLSVVWVTRKQSLESESSLYILHLGMLTIFENICFTD